MSVRAAQVTGAEALIHSDIGGDTAVVEIERRPSSKRLRWAIIEVVLALVAATAIVSLGAGGWNANRWGFLGTALLVFTPALVYIAYVSWRYLSQSYGTVRLIVDPEFVSIEHRLGNHVRRRTFERARITKAWLVLSNGSKYVYLLYKHGDVRLFRYQHKDEALAMLDALRHSAGVPQA